MKIISTLILTLAFCLAAQAQTFERKVFIPQFKEGGKRYFYIPFDVPPDTKSLTLTYDYDRRDGANVLDLGLFDAAFDETENSARGFRGWSGGRRKTVFIAEEKATHGYLAGKISAGRWRVVLGLYKIAPEGVEVTIRVRFNEIDAAAEAERQAENAKTFDFPKQARAAAPEANGYRWFRGDLHAHTFHSDGHWTIRGLLDFADANNLDFIGVTEHNTSSHHAEIERLAPAYKNLLVVRGAEVTTYGGHFNVWGLPPGKLIDFRVTPKNRAQMENLRREIERLGLPASINHPTALCGGCDWSYGDDWENFAAVEIWNGAWDLQDEAALKKWDALLQKGKRIVAVGSSDTHRPPTAEFRDGAPAGLPTVFVGAKKLSEKEIFAALKSGRVWIAENPRLFELSFTAQNGKRAAQIGEIVNAENDGEIKFRFAGRGFPANATAALVSNGKTLKSVTIERGDFSEDFAAKTETDAYFRLEVRDANGKMLAFTNPIYLRRAR